MSFDTRHVRQRRRVDTPAAATMSITNVVGSGTVAFALATEPLPPGSPKLVRHVSYPVGPLMPVFRQTT